MIGRRELDGLHDAVIGRGGGDETVAEASQGLMVVAADGDAIPSDGRAHHRPRCKVQLGHDVPMMSGHVLYEVPPANDVDDLHPAADGQQRAFAAMAHPATAMSKASCSASMS